MQINTEGTNAVDASQHGNTVSGIDTELGQDAFLKILVAQLQYQDPMNPMDDRDFITQMAQFSTLTQMQTLVRHQITSLGAGMLGQKVSLTSAAGEHIEGTVESIRWQNDELVITTDTGDSISMNEVSSVQLLEASEGEIDGGSE